VPLRNYFGWMLTTFLVYAIAGHLLRDGRIREKITRILIGLPVLVYAIFALRYILAGSIPALKAVAVFSMGMPALIALVQTWRTRSEAS
jgi:hypothetical protein